MLYHRQGRSTSIILIGTQIGGSAGTHEEQLIGKGLINSKQCGSASQLHMKYSASLGSKKYIEMTVYRQAHLFQLIPSMSEEVPLRIVHLLLAFEPIHTGH